MITFGGFLLGITMMVVGFFAVRNTNRFIEWFGDLGLALGFVQCAVAVVEGGRNYFAGGRISDCVWFGAAFLSINRFGHLAVIWVFLAMYVEDLIDSEAQTHYN